MRITDTYQHEDEVRDSELDLLGIVNHTHYLLYMMHARHKHIKALGIDFVDMHNQGFDLVLAQAELKFTRPLVTGDRYIVTSKIVSPKPGRLAFEQEVIRVADQKIAVSAFFNAACLSRKTGRPVIPQVLRELLAGLKTQ